MMNWKLSRPRNLSEKYFSDIVRVITGIKAELEPAFLTTHPQLS